MGILYFLCIFSYAVLAKKLFKSKTFANCLLGAFVFLVLISYALIFLFSSYNLAPFLIMGTGPILLIYFIFEKNTLIDIWTDNKVVAVSFIISSALLSVALLRVSVWHGDEFNYWARAVKELYSFKGSYFNPLTNMRHRDYKPSYIPLQYALTRVFGWKDGYLYFVNSSAIITALLAIIETIKVKRYSTVFFFLCLSIFTLPLGDNNLAYHSLLAEVQLGVLFTCSVIFWFFSEKNTLNSLISVMSCGVLTLIKSYSGMMFSIVLTLCIVLAAIRIRKKLFIFTAVASILILLTIQVSWSVFHSYNMKKVGFEESKIKSEMFDTVITEEQPKIDFEYLFSSNPRDSAISEYLTEGLPDEFFEFSRMALDVFTKKSLPSGNISAMFYTTALILFSLILVIIHRKDRRCLKSFIALLLGLTVYVFGIFLTYAVQAETVTSFLRYYSVVFISLNIFILFAICKHLENIKILFTCFFAIGILACMLIVFNPKYLFESTYRTEKSSYPAAENISDQLKEYMSNEGNTLLILGTYSLVGAPNDTRNTLLDYYFLEDRVSVLVRDNTASDAFSLDYFWVLAQVQKHLCNRVVVFVEFDEHISRVAYTMNISKDEPLPWIFDVIYEDGYVQFNLVS